MIVPHNYDIQSQIISILLSYDEHSNKSSRETSYSCRMIRKYSLFVPSIVSLFSLIFTFSWKNALFFNCLRLKNCFILQLHSVGKFLYPSIAFSWKIFYPSIAFSWKIALNSFNFYFSTVKCLLAHARYKNIPYVKIAIYMQSIFSITADNIGIKFYFLTMFINILVLFICYLSLLVNAAKYLTKNVKID